MFDADPSDALTLLTACPVHAPTALVPLPELARDHGWAALWAKDERSRMGLGSFKALGGVYAVADLLRTLCETAWGHRPSPAELLTPRAQAIAADLTVVCASAGNHGLSVAAGARIFGANAVVMLAETVPESFAMRLRAKGAKVERAGATYEDAMATALARSEALGWHLVSDSSWPGYVEVPATIMRGYTVMAQEVSDRFAADGAWPSHVALQAGVGGLAAAFAAHIRARWPIQPEILVVEPDAAPCLYRSMAAGRLVRADGPVSIMGRLDCKEPSLLALDILRQAADRFLVVSDREALDASGLLEAHGLATTPSGAAGLAGALSAGLPDEARVLVVVSEGPE